MVGQVNRHRAIRAEFINEAVMRRFQPLDLDMSFAWTRTCLDGDETETVPLGGQRGDLIAERRLGLG